MRQKWMPQSLLPSALTWLKKPNLQINNGWRNNDTLPEHDGGDGIYSEEEPDDEGVAVEEHSAVL